MESTLRVEDVKKMKVSDLKRELKVRGSSTVGSKEKLIARLEEEIETENAALNDDNVEESGNVDDLGEDDDDVLAGSATNANILKSIGNNKAEIETDQDKNANNAADNSSANTMTTKPTSEVDRKAVRAARFNIPTSADEVAKKEARAKRFGMESTNSSAISANSINPTEHLDKLKKRGERFGVSVAPTMKKIEQVDRLMKRKEKFGAVSVVGSDSDSRKKMRAERFGMQ